jgi:predicted acylesterase/phospholipase RssA
MAYKLKNRDEHLSKDNMPKRILALDGGGLRGILSLGILQKIEDILRERHGNEDGFRLSHYFDLIAGTSTGAIIAAILAMGWSIEKIREKYVELGERVFEKSFFRRGLFRAKYKEKKLIKELKKVYGEDTMLGGPELQTGLLIVTKRLDTGSPWPVSNNPQGQYFESRLEEGMIGNSKYPLWQVVRSSTAAPAYFDPESITIIEKEGFKPVVGEFVDGGVSPFNNPAFQAFMYATVDGYRLGWSTGADNILLVSVGTGAADPEVKQTGFTAGDAVKALLSLMNDCASLQETMLQWMSSSPTAREIDEEIGNLGNDLLAGAPLLTYLRYDVDLRKESVQTLEPELTDDKLIESLSEMDAPENMKVLHRLGVQSAKAYVKDQDFAAKFDLPPG